MIQDIETEGDAKVSRGPESDKQQLVAGRLAVSGKLVWWRIDNTRELLKRKHNEHKKI